MCYNRHMDIEIYCPECGVNKVRRQKQPCKDCQYPMYTCAECGKLFPRRRSQTKRQDSLFCNRQCMGANHGKKFGFGNR